MKGNMTPIKLKFEDHGNIREWQAEFRYDQDTKDLVKSMGFRWNPGSKTWKTLDHKVAKKLAEYLKNKQARDLANAESEVTDEMDKVAFKMSRALEPIEDINIPCPNHLKYSPYQKAMVEWCLQRYRTGRENLIVADEMGIGKTIEAIGLIQMLGLKQNPSVLVVCPASLKINWEREIRKWDMLGLSVCKVSGSSVDTAPMEDVVIINYDILLKHRTGAISWTGRDWDLIICDEAHYLKNPKAKRSVAVLGGSAKIKNGRPPVLFYPLNGKKLFLTGTPMVNRPIELWPMLKECDPGDLGSDWYRYIREYCDGHRTRYGWDTKGSSNLGKLQGKLRSSIMMRRRSIDVLTQLPPIRRQAIVLPSTSYGNLIRSEWDAYKNYDYILKELEHARSETEDDNLRERVRQLTERQSLAWAELAEARKNVGLAKVDHTLEHVKHVVESRGKVVLFSWHRAVIDQLMLGLEKEALNPVKLTGSSSLEQRQTAVDLFQSQREVKVIVLNLEAGGVGITLTGTEQAGFCTSVCFSELDWRPSTMAQAEARVWRRSVDESAQNVLVHHIVIDGSLDANISNKLLDKQDVIDQAIN